MFSSAIAIHRAFSQSGSNTDHLGFRSDHMPLPEFNAAGRLPEGEWNCTDQDFIVRFCKGGTRQRFRQSVEDIFDYATAAGAASILFGGSFITKNPTPNDIDCVMIFPTEELIRERRQRVDINGAALELFFCAETQVELLNSFRALFSKTTAGSGVGTVRVDIKGTRGTLWQASYQVDPKTFEIVKRTYANRHVVDRTATRGAIITVHGIRSHGEWNAEIAHIASSNGWIIAPFVYGYKDVTDVRTKVQRKAIVNGFRDHICGISERYKCHVSVIAHSFGTYIAMSYLVGFDVPPVPIDTLILTGSVVSDTLDFNKVEGKVARIINEIAPNDEIVGYVPLAAKLAGDPLFGQSGTDGFREHPEFLEQRECEIFDHNNVIRRDVIAKKWMPWLEMAVGQGKKSAHEGHVHSLCDSDIVESAPTALAR